MSCVSMKLSVEREYNSFEADKWPMSSYVVFYNKMYMWSSLTLCALVTKYHLCLSTHSNRIAECILVLYTSANYALQGLCFNCLLAGVKV